jgi:hypothetical protein
VNPAAVALSALLRASQLLDDKTAQLQSAARALAPGGSHELYNTRSESVGLCEIVHRD